LPGGRGITGPGGVDTIPLAGFFTGPGQTVLAKGEIVSKVLIPLSRGAGVYYKLNARKAMDIAFVGVAVYLELAGSMVAKARIGLGAVALTPIRARQAEAMIEGRPLTPEAVEAAGAQAARESSPISDLRAGAAYRREMVAALTRRGLLVAYARAEGRVDHGQIPPAQGRGLDGEIRQSSVLTLAATGVIGRVLPGDGGMVAG
jgi:carbon-monoxide dehydrogenase medium subunit